MNKRLTAYSDSLVLILSALTSLPFTDQWQNVIPASKKHTDQEDRGLCATTKTCASPQMFKIKCERERRQCGVHFASSQQRPFWHLLKVGVFWSRLDFSGEYHQCQVTNSIQQEEKSTSAQLCSYADKIETNHRALQKSTIYGNDSVLLNNSQIFTAYNRLQSHTSEYY